MDTISDNQDFAREAKALVALAFRNGPIEDVHAGKPCPTCGGQPGFGRITDAEMRGIMKGAVDQIYRLLCMKTEDPRMYESEVGRGAAYTAAWDEPSGAPKQTPQAGPGVPSKLADGGVLVTIPLGRRESSTKDSKRPYSLEQRRNRLERIVSYIAFTFQNGGKAFAYECKVKGNMLTLLLTGVDSKAIAAELQSYFSLLKLPNGTKLLAFKGASSEPDEINLG